MKTEQINTLLNKFWAGESTINEERQLKFYFSQELVAEEHQQYLGYFQLLNKERNQKKQVDLKAIKKSEKIGKLSSLQIIKRIGIAAAIMAGIIISSSLYQQKNTTFPLQKASQLEIELAYKQTAEVLALLSNTLNKANESIYEIGIIDKSKSKIEKTN